MSVTQPAPLSQKFRIEKTTLGDVTLLAMHGVLDEGFEGQKTAESVRTKKLVLSMRDVRRFASWGMAEWMNFLRGTAELDLYLVECSTYAVNQMNLVTGLLGHGKLVSFYSPYRCGRCGEEFEALLLLPTDRETIRNIAQSEQLCRACGGSARMDKYPATMYAALADLPLFDIDDGVVQLLRTRLKYNLVPDVARFRAFRRVNKGYTYLRLSGNLATLPPELLTKSSEGTTIIDLANIVFDPSALTQWRVYIRSVLQVVTSLQLLDCPPGFLENAVVAEDLGKLKVRTFALLYHCASCNAMTSRMVDVAQNLEELSDGTVPTTRCPTCQMVLSAPPTDGLSLLRRLPARERDIALDKFLVSARGEAVGKLEDCLISRPDAKPTAPAAPRAMYVASGLGLLIVAVLAVIAVSLWRKHDEPPPNTNGPIGPVVTPPATPNYQRPDWVMSSVPSSAFCQDMINRLVCVGVSSYRPSRNEATADATDAALDELVNAIGLKITNPFFKDNVLSGYSETRAKALSALQAVEMDRTGPQFAAADDVVRKARRRVVEILQASGGAAVPAQRSDWHWEEYAIDKGIGTEFLVFIRYDVNLDAVKSLVAKYSETTLVGASSAVTAFPALAWQYADFKGGAMMTKVARPLSAANVAPRSIVMAVGDQHLNDALAFAHKIDEWSHATGDLKLTVKSGDAAPAELDVHH